MSLPDVAALKRVLKIENTAEDTLVGELLARATSVCQSQLGVPITAVPMSFVDDCESNLARQVGVRSLIIPTTPLAAASLVLKDKDGTTIDNATLLVDAVNGTIRYLDGSRFCNGPYTIVGNVGLSAHPRYAEWTDLIAQIIVDLVADAYTRRNPSQLSHAAGGGNSATYTLDGIPKRIRDELARIRQEL